MSQPIINALAPLLTGRVLVFSGAGISVASGLSTFTGHGGLYEGLDPYQLASPEGFAARPGTVWNWYLMRIRQGLEAKPNAAHLALAEVETLAQRFTIVTLNVDPLHERAGSQRVFKLHGNILETRCCACNTIEELQLERMPEQCSDDLLPLCECGGVLRPNVVWFGERPWQQAISVALEEIPQADLILEVGQSGTVSYGFSELAAQMGRRVLRINPDERSSGGGIIGIKGVAEEVLPVMASLVRSSL
jgi:NAD-dependent deacetylase